MDQKWPGTGIRKPQSMEMLGQDTIARPAVLMMPKKDRQDQLHQLHGARQRSSSRGQKGPAKSMGPQDSYCLQVPYAVLKKEKGAVWKAE